MKLFLNLFTALIFLALGQNTFAQAWDHNSQGREKAAREVCLKMSFSSDQQACLDLIRGYYFEESAVDVCIGTDFRSSKMPCLRAARGKGYDRYETDACAAMSFDSDQIECLQKSGYPRDNDECSDKIYDVRTTIQKVLMTLNPVHNQEARNQLEDLLRRLDRR